LGILQNTVAFVVVLGLMIFFHEFGHFATAKLMGMRVFVFSFGFGRRLAGFRRRETDYRISLVPLGGYVKLEGEPEDFFSEQATSEPGAQVAPDSPDCFTNRPRWQRFLVYLAGPAMNAVLTILVLTALLMRGYLVDAVLYDRPVVGALASGSPAEAAGLRPGDELLSVDGRDHETWEDFQYAILLRPDALVRIGVRRDGQVLEVPVRSRATAQRVGEIGVTPPVRLGEVQRGSAADGLLRSDDAVLAVDGVPVRSFEEIRRSVLASQGRSLRLSLLRGAEALTVEVTPRLTDGAPRLGVGPKYVVKKFALGGAVREAARETWKMTRQTFDTLKGLVTARLSPKTMVGPLGIAGAAGEAARDSVWSLLRLVAILSLQVGILNLFPLPPLDGGHLAILAGESVVRRDFSLRVKVWIMNAGAMALLLLIGIVLYSDLSRTSWLGKYLP
jgi:regulator of sigma E protease